MGKRSWRTAALGAWIALGPVTIPLAAQDGERPDVHAHFRFGSFPWSQQVTDKFADENVRMLIAAFDEGWSVDKFIKETGSATVDVLTLLDEFEDMGLVEGPDDYAMRPRFPVFREADLARVEPFLEKDAAELEQIVEDRWGDIEEFVATLEAGRNLPPAQILYQVIVGGVFLGGVVDALYEDQTLMPPPPRRGRQGEAYYAWMTEGDAIGPILVQQSARVGRYEVHSVGPVVAENPRFQIEEVARDGPVYETEDARRWRIFASVFSRDHILPYVKSRRSGLIELQGAVHASRYTSLAEFAAWYYHSLVARVADRLIESGRIEPPDLFYRYALRSLR